MRLFTNFLGGGNTVITRWISVIFQKLASCGMPKIPEDANTEPDHPITREELREAAKEGKRHKSPGPDGICHEFFTQMWDVVKNDLLDVINNMYMERAASDAKTRPHCVSTKKKVAPVSPENYRPLTILNRLQITYQKHSKPPESIYERYTL